MLGCQTDLSHRRVPVDGSCLLLQLRQVVGVVGQVGEHHPLLVVVLAQDLVVAQEKTVADAKPETVKQLKLQNMKIGFKNPYIKSLHPASSALVRVARGALYLLY